MKTAFRTAYSKKNRCYAKPDLDEDGNVVSLTKVAHKDECDVNNVLRRYDQTGLITHVNTAVARYGDFSEINEYQESLNLVIEAQQSFGALPSAIRERFANNPGKFLEFVTNPANIDEMCDLGLAEKRSPEPTLNQPTPKAETEPRGEVDPLPT